jgi:hypothetical protein
MGDFKITKEKQWLTFIHEERGEARFNINTNECFVEGKKKESLKYYFREYRVYSRHYGDGRVNMLGDINNMKNENYSKFINFVIEKVNYSNGWRPLSIGNLGNILPHLSNFENVNNWISCGVNCTHIINIKPNEIPKDVRKLMVKFGIEINGNSFSKIENDKDFFTFLVRIAYHEKIIPRNEEILSNFWDSIFNSFYDIKTLVQEFNYDLRSLFKYIYNYILPYENYSSGVYSDLKDYYKMQNDMEIKDIDKYPKFLKSKHNIVSGDYNQFKQEYSEKIFKSRMNKDLEYVGKKFGVFIPSCSQDVKAEGKNLNHCVSSYISRIINCESQIIFLRKEKNKSLVTVELRGKTLIQAKGYGNRLIEKEEKSFLQEYCNKKKLIMRI